MHILAVITFAAIWAILPVKLCAIAATCYALVAATKTIFPALTGWKALTLNITLSVVGVFAAATPAMLQTSTFWASFMLTVAAAAGIHGTVTAKLITKPESSPV